MLPFVKNAVACAANSRLASAFVRLLEQCDGERPGLLRILTYHRIVEPAEAQSYPGVISATPAMFSQQMALLAERYRVVMLDNVIRAFADRRPLPPRAVLLTFDDAYRDFADHAWPVLQRLKLPVTLFVPTAYPGEPARLFWWDRIHRAVMRSAACTLATPWGWVPAGNPRQRRQLVRKMLNHIKALPGDEAVAVVEDFCSGVPGDEGDNDVLSWNDLRRLAGEGVTLAPHTHTHPLLHRLAPDKVFDEVTRSIEELERNIGPAPRALAYPSGGVNDEVVLQVRRAGIQLALTTRRGMNRIQSADPLLLRRINVGQRAAAPLFRAQLLACSRHWSRLLPA